jgi:hypothetical protein
MMGASNFRALLRERGKIVPGSLREEHNIFTNAGRNWLSRLIAWQSIGDVDVSYIDDRIYGIAVGSLAHPESRSVDSLKNEQSLVQAMSSFPFSFGVRFTAEFLEWYIPTVLIQEAGLITMNGILVAYKTFVPLLKAPDFRLEVQWDLRF